jgi:peptidoglycan hydrolase CwlO-like protein
MNLTKLFKVIEFAWPFIKEIVLDKDAPKSDRRKKGIAFTMLVTVIFFGGGAWGMVEEYITPFLPPNQNNASTQNDRTDWVRFLEKQMTEQVNQIAELQVKFNMTQSQLETQLERAEGLEKEIENLRQRLQEETARGPSDEGVQEPRVLEPDIFDQLEYLRGQ